MPNNPRARFSVHPRLRVLFALGLILGLILTIIPPSAPTLHAQTPGDGDPVAGLLLGNTAPDHAYAGDTIQFNAWMRNNSTETEDYFLTIWLDANAMAQLNSVTVEYGGLTSNNCTAAGCTIEVGATLAENDQTNVLISVKMGDVVSNAQWLTMTASGPAQHQIKSSISLGFIPLCGCQPASKNAIRYWMESADWEPANAQTKLALTIVNEYDVSIDVEGHWWIGYPALAQGSQPHITDYPGGQISFHDEDTSPSVNGYSIWGDIHLAPHGIVTVYWDIQLTHEPMQSTELWSFEVEQGQGQGSIQPFFGKRTIRVSPRPASGDFFFENLTAQPIPGSQQWLHLDLQSPEATQFSAGEVNDSCRAPGMPKGFTSRSGIHVANFRWGITVPESAAGMICYVNVLVHRAGLSDFTVTWQYKPLSGMPHITAVTCPKVQTINTSFSCDVQFENAGPDAYIDTKIDGAIMPDSGTANLRLRHLGESVLTFSLQLNDHTAAVDERQFIIIGVEPKVFVPLARK